MKKTLAIIFALVFSAAVFSQQYTINVDITAGIPLGFSTFTPKESINDIKIKFTEIDFGMKIQTYSCFLLNGTIGVYASAGFGVGLGLQTEKGQEVAIADGGSGKSTSFMIGPAFGITVQSLRLQTGLAFHFATASMDSFMYEGTHKKFNACGIALTPQVRFFADKRCSFVVGADFAFGFPKTILETDSYGKTNEIKYKSGFRFGCTPYLGFGVNFGR